MEKTQQTFTTSDLNKHVGDVLDAALRSPVGITRHGKTRFILASVEHFERLRRQDARKAYRVEDIPEDRLAAFLAANADLLDEAP